MPENVEYVIRLRDEFSRQMKGADVSARSFDKSMNLVRGTLTSILPIAGAAGAAMAFKVAIDIGAGFEKEMSNVLALTQTTKNEFKKMEKLAEDLGRSTAFSAKQAAEGMSFLSMAGFDTKSIMEAIPGVLDLAAAGSLDLGRAADIASNVLTQFGLAATEMGRVNDIIVKTTTKSNTNVEQLAEALKYTGTTAKILKIPLEETSAALGILGNAGLQGSMGGTSLNFALLEMSRVSSPTAQKLKELGVQTHNSQGEFIGLTNILEQFEKRGIKSTTILDTFGARGGRAMGTLVEAGSKAVKELNNLNKASKGISKTVAEMKLDNLSGDMVKLKSASQGLAISFSKRLNPGLRDATQMATKFVTKLEDLIKIKPYEEINKQTTAATVLVGKLRNVNLTESERIDIINKLNEISPILTKNIDSENLSTEQLTKNLNEYNKQQAKRIVLAGLEERELKLINKEASRRAKIERILAEGAAGGAAGGLLASRERLLELGAIDSANKLGKFIQAIYDENIQAAEKAFKEGDFIGFTKDEARRAINQLKAINSEKQEQIDLNKRIQSLQGELGLNIDLNIGDLDLTELKKELDSISQNIITFKTDDKDVKNQLDILKKDAGDIKTEIVDVEVSGKIEKPKFDEFKSEIDNLKTQFSAITSNIKLPENVNINDNREMELTRTSTITSTAPKVFNINIEAINKNVGGQSSTIAITTNNIKDISDAELKRKFTTIFTDMLNDVQQMAS